MPTGEERRGAVPRWPRVAGAGRVAGRPLLSKFEGLQIRPGATACAYPLSLNEVPAGEHHGDGGAGDPAGLENGEEAGAGGGRSVDVLSARSSTGSYERVRLLGRVETTERSEARYCSSTPAR
jgi:hypothetical protein